jgi:fatty acid desaturase 2 (delta-6 desaturase)
MNLFKANHLFFFLLLSHIVVMEIVSWFIIFYFGNGWIPTLLTAFVLATSQVRHDTLEVLTLFPALQRPGAYLLMG